MLLLLHPSQPTLPTFNPGKTRLPSLNDISLNIKDVIFGHSVLHVEYSRGEANTDPISRRHTNAVVTISAQESSGNRVHDKVDDLPPDSTEIIVPRQDSVEEKLIRAERGEQEEIPLRVEEPANSPGSDEKLADDNEVDGSVSEELLVPTEEKMYNSVPSAGTELDNFIPKVNAINSSVQGLDFPPDKKKSFEGRGENSGLLEDGNDDRSDVEVDLELSSEAKENFEGGAAKEEIQLENRHDVNIDDRSGPDENHVHTPIEMNVSLTEMVRAPSPTKVVEITIFGDEGTSGRERYFQQVTDDLARSGLPKENLKYPHYARDHLDLNVPLRRGLPQGLPLPKQTSCKGRHAYVYTLPPQFNSDLVAQCDSVAWIKSACDYFMINEGMGPNAPTDHLNDTGETVLVPNGSWYRTHQYALELMFNARLKHYDCLTTDVNEADLFFVPYYAGHDVMRFVGRTDVSNDQRDELAFELMNWLEGKETWNRNNDSDHVFVLGKIESDFRRPEQSHFGSKFLDLPFMIRPTKLVIESFAWKVRDISVPHPTFFHPKDDDQIRTWLAHVEQSERRHLVSFAGMPRPNNVREQSISPDERTAMRTRIIREIIPGLLYSQPGTKHSDFRDAFDISIEALFHRFANLRAEEKPM
ncbi:unnamed protein product [Calypogeia fissa]